MKYQLNISGLHYEMLKNHLYPGDGKEAVAIALCGRYLYNGLSKIMIHELYPIPYEDCFIREEDIIQWDTKIIQSIFEKAHNKHLSILKIHSHPTGYKEFSDTDDKSDEELFTSAYGWIDDEGPHASAIMLPNGEIFGRFFLEDLTEVPIDKILVIGDEIKSFPISLDIKADESGKRTAQAFGNKTYQLLKGLKVGIVGCSGTGSPVIEQLVRLGVGELIIADPDYVEHKNVNRILHTTIEHANSQKLKVDVLEEGINKIGLGTIVKSFNENIYNSEELLLELASCDFIFGCMDSVDGRHLLNQLATFYLIPYIDLGVKLEADGKGGISKICGSSHYLQPGKSSLLSRGVYTTEDLRAAGQFRKNPEEYANLLKNSYIKNINVERPAVISVNMLISSIGVNEFLNRLHPYKVEQPKYYATIMIDLTESYIVNSNEDEMVVDAYLLKRIGRGNMQPFLDTPELSDKDIK
jgi:hypothetical protein